MQREYLEEQEKIKKKEEEVSNTVAPLFDILVQ